MMDYYLIWINSGWICLLIVLYVTIDGVIVMCIDKKIALLLFVICVICAMPGCEQERTSGVGLSLPQGNIENGKLAFIDLGCNKCHKVNGVEIPEYVGETSVTLNLGGEVLKVKTYGELVTSIVNPTHIISVEYIKMLGDLPVKDEVSSIMPSFNKEMSVEQLIDLVTFLDSRYEKMELYYTDFQYIGPY